MKNSIIIIALIFISFVSNGQTNWRWARGAGGSTNDQAMDIAVHPNGNSYTTGYFSSDSVRFGNITILRNGAFQFLLVKHDSSGNAL